MTIKKTTTITETIELPELNLEEKKSPDLGETCDNCKYTDLLPEDEPCASCSHCYVDKWEAPDKDEDDEPGEGWEMLAEHKLTEDEKQAMKEAGDRFFELLGELLQKLPGQG